MNRSRRETHPRGEGVAVGTRGIAAHIETLSRIDLYRLAIKKDSFSRTQKTAVEEPPVQAREVGPYVAARELSALARVPVALRT